MNAQLRLRWLNPGDLEHLMNLETICFKDPWTRRNFLDEFDKSFCLPYGLFIEKQLLAYQFAWLLPPETHLLSLAVHPDFRGQGLARYLLKLLIKTSQQASSQLIFLEVRPDNDRAMDLYQGLGFILTGRRRAYYDDGEDAYLMTLELYPFLGKD